MSAPNLITPVGLQRIRDELEWLRGIERPRIVAEVAYAASLGDRSENAEYIFGKKRLREIDGRVTFLVKNLSKVEVVDPAKQTGEVVRFGATVEVEDEDGNERTWKIYGAHEVDVDAGIISFQSPMGQALMGKRPGDDVLVRTPGGARELEVLAVRFEAQEPLPEPAWRAELGDGPVSVERA